MPTRGGTYWPLVGGVLSRGCIAPDMEEKKYTGKTLSKKNPTEINCIFYSNHNNIRQTRQSQGLLYKHRCYLIIDNVDQGLRQKCLNTDAPKRLELIS